jgi:hypothetical protein
MDGVNLNGRPFAVVRELSIRAGTKSALSAYQLLAPQNQR